MQCTSKIDRNLPAQTGAVYYCTGGPVIHTYN